MLGLGFHAFGDGLQVQDPADGHDKFELRVRASVGDVNEDSIDFDLLERKGAESGERCVPSTEVIDGDLHPRVGDRSEVRLDVRIVELLGFDELEGELVGRETRLGEGVGHGLGEGGLQELAGRDVDGDAQVGAAWQRGEERRLLTSGTQDVAATGREVLTQALRAGHEVTAFVRNPAALQDLAGQVRIATGDATSVRDLAAVLPGHDAVLSALGSGTSIRSDIASRAAEALAAAAEQTAMSRLVVLSAFGVGSSLEQASATQKIMYRTVMRSLFADKARADGLIRASGLDWTLVYPVTLTNGPATGGSYRASEQLPMKGMPKISRADVAQFMLAAAADTGWIHRTAVLSH